MHYLAVPATWTDRSVPIRGPGKRTRWAQDLGILRRGRRGLTDRRRLTRPPQVAEERLWSHAAIIVAHGHLLLGWTLAVVQKVLRVPTSETAKPLGGADEFVSAIATTQEASKKLE